MIQLHRNAHTNHCQDSVVFGTELIINSRYRRVLVDGSLLDLTKKEFDLFCFWQVNLIRYSAVNNYTAIFGTNTLHSETMKRLNPI